MIELAEIERARDVIAQIAVRTPLVCLNADADAEIYLKLETLQPVNSFKIRGAYVRIARLTAWVLQADRLGAARQLVERFDCVVVLKGSGTVIAAPGQICAINPTGNARLATAGTGDVLAGMIGARLAAGRSAFSAACEAVYQHGLAADHWSENRALTARALAEAVSR